MDLNNIDNLIKINDKYVQQINIEKNELIVLKEDALDNIDTINIEKQKSY